LIYQQSSDRANQGFCDDVLYKNRLTYLLTYLLGVGARIHWQLGRGKRSVSVSCDGVEWRRWVDAKRTFWPDHS